MSGPSKRKSAAIALALVGVVGLSLATAAQLTVNASNEVAIGADTFVHCDTDGVDVSYTYVKSGGVYVIDDLTVSDIATECTDESIALTLADASGAELVSTTGTIAGDAFVYPAASDAIDIETDLGDVTVIIG